MAGVAQVGRFSTVVNIVLLVTSTLVTLVAGNHRSTQCQVLSEAL